MESIRRMEGKRVLVTGAGSGIGRGVALEFAKEGAAVVLHYWPTAEGAESAVEAIRQGGGKAKAIAADFRRLEQVNQLAVEAIEFLGGIDILVNNVGITMNLPFEDVTVEQFDTIYVVNIRAQFFLTQAVVPTMAKQGKGIVINVASTHAFAGMTEYSVYSGTKGAVVSYSRELALELIQKGIRVNAVAPGWIWVERHRQALGDPFDTEAAGRQVPAGFLGSPTDIGRLAIFLASDESRYSIGQTIIIDGGQTAIMPLTGDFRKERKEDWSGGHVPGFKKR